MCVASFFLCDTTKEFSPKTAETARTQKTTRMMTFSFHPMAAPKKYIAVFPKDCQSY